MYLALISVGGTRKRSIQAHCIGDVDSVAYQGGKQGKEDDAVPDPRSTRTTPSFHPDHFPTGMAKKTNDDKNAGMLNCPLGADGDGAFVFFISGPPSSSRMSSPSLAEGRDLRKRGRETE